MVYSTEIQTTDRCTAIYMAYMGCGINGEEGGWEVKREMRSCMRVYCVLRRRSSCGRRRAEERGVVVQFNLELSVFDIPPDAHQLEKTAGNGLMILRRIHAISAHLSYVD